MMAPLPPRQRQPAGDERRRSHRGGSGRGRGEAVAEPYLAAVLNNCNESRTLDTIREALLPRLLSGEIRVKDAEKLVGGAT